MTAAPGVIKNVMAPVHPESVGRVNDTSMCGYDGKRQVVAREIFPLISHTVGNWI